MSLLWRKTSVTANKDEVLREAAIKNALTQGLGQAVNILQQQHINSNEAITSGDFTNNVCHYLEAIFIHGLKDSFFEKMSAILTNNPDRSPEPNFWPFLMVFSHKDVIAQIENLSQINTDVGRCRAWIRLALNDGLLESYVAAMVQDKATLEYYYRNAAYLADSEQPDIMRKYIEGLSLLQFKLACNSHMLNLWTTTPLILAGIWNPPVAPEPVVTGIDIASCFDDSGQQMTPDRKKKARGRLKPKETEGDRQSESRVLEIGQQKPGSEIGSESSSLASCPDPIPPLCELDYDEKLNLVLKLEDSCLISGELIETTTVNNTADDETNSSVCNLGDINQTGSISEDGNVALISANEDSGMDLDDGSSESQNLSMGNSLIGRKSWSSSFEETLARTQPIQVRKRESESSTSEDASFQTLLQNYSPIQSTIIRTPDLVDMMNSVLSNAPLESSPQERESQTSTPTSSADETEFEILPKTCSLTSTNADKRTQELLAVIGEICNEVGLDAQNYQCKACGRPIGMIYGRARVCCYDGYSYCYECHENEECYIPARIIHNWDFKKYKVAKHTKTFLQLIQEEPLIDVRQTNPLLYSISEEMNELQKLRTQLSYLRSYLFSCRESVAEEMRRKLWPKEYLYEHIHLYSLSDLLQVTSRTLAQLLIKVIASAIKHVNECRLCSQKGFICEICKNPKVIYPFQLEITYRCEKCLAVYHSVCMTSSQLCRKCDRRRKREGHEEFDWNLDD